MRKRRRGEGMVERGKEAGRGKGKAGGKGGGWSRKTKIKGKNCRVNFSKLIGCWPDEENSSNRI